MSVDAHIGDAAELYALGALAPSERALVDAHIATCPSCLRQVGDAEETVLALEREERPLPTPAALDRRIRFAATPKPVSYWAALAAAFLIGLLPSFGYLMMHRQDTAHDVAIVAMVNSHFNHSQFTGRAAPHAKVIYAKDRSWIYVIVQGPERYDVYALAAGTSIKLGTTSGTRAATMFFERRPPVAASLELRRGEKTLATAQLR